MKLTIIIPAYNCYDTLKEVVAKLDKQLTEETELLIVDDGSTDELHLDPSPFVYHAGGNFGVSAARNIGVSLAKGEYVTFVDADDLVTDDFVQLILSAIKTGKDLYWFKARTEDGYDNWHITPVWAKVIKKSIAEKYPFNETKLAGEDILWNEQIAADQTITSTKVDNVIYQYRWSANPDSLSKRHNRGEFA